MRSAPVATRYASIFTFTALIGAWSARASAQQPQQPMQAGGLAPPPPMQSGGLAPPPPGSGPPPPAPTYPPATYPGATQYPDPNAPNATQRQLEASEREDSGRGLEFAYFQLEGGVQHASLTAIKEDGMLLAGTDKNSGFAPYFGGTAGMRFVYVTVGPRFRYAPFTDWSVWTLNLDVGWHAPFGKLETDGTIGAGYTKVTLSDEVKARSGDTSIGGFDIRLGSGLDYYFSNAFSVGGMIAVDFLRLSRGPVPSNGTMAGWPPEWNQDASSIGLVLNAGLTAGLHF
jgi:hypothetical protein